ncbi:hypothetical protein [Rhodococcus spongiicola]|uniref:PPE family domain-containing protein n=1 Tax=Rhodococcus spongiicola TaxID=2487352 RepID=A0A438AXC5_9NOCA|nr:hypothetical protein [Rhodococcus spongiicola]RVW03364.1 hypothetical protein EF834_09480 [Rhodococcus spongiicola]
MSSKDLLDLLAAPLGGAGAIERERLDTSIEQIGDTVDLEVDAPYVTDPDVFVGLSREEMAAKVSALDAGMIMDLAHRYLSVASAFNIVWGLTNLKRITGSTDWEGAAADAANAAIERMMDPVNDTHASIRTISLKLQQASSAASDVKPRVQSLLADMQPLLLLTSATSAVEAKAQQEEQRREAAQILERIYKPSFIEAGTNVPAILPPPTIPGVQGFETGGWTGTAAPTRGGAANSGTGSTDSDEPASPGVDDTESTQATGTEDAATVAGEGIPPDSQGKANSPVSTFAANANGPQGGVPSSGGAGGGASGIAGGGVANGSAGQPKFDSPSAAMASGSAAPRVAAGGATGAGAGAGATRPGAGMGMGMPMGGRGAGTGDDTEHKTPDYLINMENGNDLIGDLDPVAPPVLGA